MPDEGVLPKRLDLLRRYLLRADESHMLRKLLLPDELSNLLPGSVPVLIRKA